MWFTKLCTHHVGHSLKYSVTRQPVSVLFMLCTRQCSLCKKACMCPTSIHSRHQGTNVSYWLSLKQTRNFILLLISVSFTVAPHKIVVPASCSQFAASNPLLPKRNAQTPLQFATFPSPRVVNHHPLEVIFDSSHSKKELLCIATQMLQQSRVIVLSSP